MIKTEYNENNDITTIYLEYNEYNLKKYNVDRLQFLGFDNPTVEIQLNKIKGGNNINIENITIPYKYFHILMDFINNKIKNNITSNENSNENNIGEKLKNTIKNSWEKLNIGKPYKDFENFLSKFTYPLKKKNITGIKKKENFIKSLIDFSCPAVPPVAFQ